MQTSDKNSEKWNEKCIALFRFRRQSENEISRLISVMCRRVRSIIIKFPGNPQKTNVNKPMVTAPNDTYL